jgi:N-acetylglucosamine kinase-like BadF-type ATPase
MARKDYFLGVDGGQSHTTALVADLSGRILGSGQAGPSNHTLAPGGKRRLELALQRSVGQALAEAGLAPAGRPVRRFRFESAHLAMTGEPQDKVATVEATLTARRIEVGHDAPGALAGATAGKDGIIVLAGTGSVTYGRFRGRTARVGGRGYIFADQGSAWAIARDAISQTQILEERGRSPRELHAALLRFFKRTSVEEIIEDFYRHRILRDRVAAFAEEVERLAGEGDRVSGELLRSAARDLAEMAEAVATRLGALGADIRVTFGGGVFRGARVRGTFEAQVGKRLPQARVVTPLFGPDVGALLLAYRQDGIRLSPSRIANIRRSHEELCRTSEGL